MKVFLGILVSLILIGLLIKHDSSKKNKRIQAVFSSRDSLTNEEFYQSFYKTKGASLRVIQGVRKVLEEQLDADMSRLAATDDFSKNLAFFFEFDSMADVEIICGLEKEFAIKITDSEAEKTRTIDDIIQLVITKTKTLNAT
ncbi:MAG: acyl carrier protein [Nitrosomonadales bacterium]|nr:acyl carrier protein [Nitrosomonadales bacterium]